MKKTFALIAVLAAIMMVAAACTGGQGDTGPQGDQGTAGESARPGGIPEGAQQLSGIVPGMGEHWGNPADMPLGPIYGVMNNQVVFAEYMFTEAMLEEVSISTPEGEATFKELTELMVGAPVDHIDVTFTPGGHDGFEESHWDVHAYLVSHEEHLAYAPGVAGPYLVTGPSLLSAVPEVAVQLTPVIPGMGEHWADMEDMPLGPIYGVFQNDIVYMEYMYTQDMLEEQTASTPEGDMLFSELADLAVNLYVDHMDVSFNPEGHEGFEAPHWDIHAYSVTHDTHMAFAP